MLRTLFEFRETRQFITSGLVSRIIDFQENSPIALDNHGILRIVSHLFFVGVSRLVPILKEKTENKWELTGEKWLRLQGKSTFGADYRRRRMQADNCPTGRPTPQGINSFLKNRVDYVWRDLRKRLKHEPTLMHFRMWNS